MADIELDLGDLHTLWVELSRVHRRFGEAEGVDPRLLDAVGHAGLGGRLRDFGSSWDERREDLGEDLDKVWRGIRLVEEVYRELDLTLAREAPPRVDWS